MQCVTRFSLTDPDELKGTAHVNLEAGNRTFDMVICSHYDGMVTFRSSRDEKT